MSSSPVLSGAVICAAESNCTKFASTPCSLKKPFVCAMKSGASLTAPTIPTETLASSARTRAGAKTAAVSAAPVDATS
jgi:hypothetical protein